MNLAKVNFKRRNPLFPVGLDSILNEFINSGISYSKDHSFVNQVPAVNVMEKENEFILEVAVPGLEKGDIQLKVEDETLIIHAEKESSEEELKENYSRREFNYQNFTRSFQLNETIDIENINASYELGILNITLPKIKEDEKSKNRNIDIQ